MNWEAIGAVGEVFGAIAVVVTLLYLARQTKKNAEAVDASASRDAAYKISEWHREAARDPEIKRIIMKSLAHEDSEYNVEEWWEFRALAISLFFLYQTHYIQSALKIGSEEESEMYIRYAKDIIDGFPIWRKFWEQGIESGLFLNGYIHAVNSSQGEDLASVFKELRVKSATDT